MKTEFDINSEVIIKRDNRPQEKYRVISIRIDSNKNIKYNLDPLFHIFNCPPIAEYESDLAKPKEASSNG